MDAPRSRLSRSRSSLSALPRRSLPGTSCGRRIPHGAIEGATAFAFAWLLLRYDLRAVPAFVATGLVLEALRAAFLAATPSGWLSFAVTAAVVAR